jgi:uncharacterized protein
MKMSAIDTQLQYLPKIPFTIHSEGHLLKGEKTSEENTSLLCMHGAGTSSKHLLEPLRIGLFTHQLHSAAFDFIGHGDTGGVLAFSSLHERLNQACDVIEALCSPQPLSIIASSMSGYTAIKLTEKYMIQNLILFVPAVYHVDAFSIPFNQGFSDIIRQPKSWLHTDAWDILQKFEGNLLIVYAENDAVIPVEIVEKLYESAANAKTRKMHLVEKSPHRVLDFLAQNQAVLQDVIDVVVSLLR